MKTVKMMLILLCLISVESLFGAGKGWLTDFNTAKKEAAEKNLPIFIYFSGSDWCRYCIRLDAEVFSKKEFKKYIKDNFIPLMIDFPMKTKLAPELKKQNDELAEKYRVQGFPTVIILGKNEKILSVSNYIPGGVDVYIDFLKKIKARIK